VLALDDDDIIRLAGLGAFLTAYAATRGATSVASDIYEWIQDPAGNIVDKASKIPVLEVLGYGRKGGIL